VESIDFNIYRGDTFERAFQLMQDGVPVDIANRTITAQIRRAPNTALIAAFDVAKVEPQVDGIFQLALTASATQALSGRYVWDAHVVNTDDDTVLTPMGGVIIVTPDITRVGV
jgi:hypothetical protein